MGLPKRAADRIAAGLKRFQPVLQAARARDVNESDTVVIVTDLLQDVFGYDKYHEITSEQRIRGAYCDLLVNIENSPALLIEVKAIGLDPKEQHVRQAVDYAANKGLEWVALTNGVRWQVFKVTFTKPIERELVVEFDLLACTPKSEEDVERIGLLAKEGWQKARLSDYYSEQQVLSRFSIAAVVLSDPVVEVARRELRRVSGVKVEVEDVRRVLREEVLKREVQEGEKAEEARRLVNRAASRSIKSSSTRDEEPATDREEAVSRDAAPPTGGTSATSADPTPAA